MYLIRKGEKPRPICRTCRALHSRRTCPIRQPRNAEILALLAAAKEFFDARKTG